ncbi:MAG: FAD-dependent oxidoreductase [Acidimicrobiales bacterium]
MRLLVVGGSDGGISAAMRARELDRGVDVTVVLADAHPNFSICDIPYYVSGDVADWHDLAHRTRSDIEALGITVLTDTTAEQIDVVAHRVTATDPYGTTLHLSYDRLVIATGAVPVRPPIDRLERLGPADGVHLLHTMGDTHAAMESLRSRQISTAVIVGAGYIELEMAEALRTRGVAVTQMEALPQVLPILDAEVAQLVAEQLVDRGVDVHTATKVTGIDAGGRRLTVRASDVASGEAFEQETAMVFVVTGVTPDTALAKRAGIDLANNGAIVVDRRMMTSATDVLAAGDCVRTHHLLLGETYLPLGATAHKQGRVAGESALGGDRRFAGSLGTQVVKVFELVTARTGLRDYEAGAAGFHPRTEASVADDHKAYYPGARAGHVRTTGDSETGRLLGVQMIGAISTAVHKRIDTAASAIFAGLAVDQLCDLDLSYTPPLGSPWDVLQAAAQQWVATKNSDGGDGQSLVNTASRSRSSAGFE